MLKKIKFNCPPLRGDPCPIADCDGTPGLHGYKVGGVVRVTQNQNILSNSSFEISISKL
jgi:hypothetical protein